MLQSQKKCEKEFHLPLTLGNSETSHQAHCQSPKILEYGTRSRLTKGTVAHHTIGLQFIGNVR